MTVPPGAVTGIKAQLDQAYAKQAEAQREIKQLTERLIAASRRHWWPMSEPSRLCGAADGDMTGDPKAVTCQACIDSVPEEVSILLRGDQP